MRKFALLLMLLVALGHSLALAQTRKISGTVTSAEDGSTLPGVSVVVKGTTIGKTTDLDGKYTLEVPEDAKELEFSFVGMKTKLVVVAGKQQVNVELEKADINVDEVLVVAYGTAKRESFTGSASVVKTDKLEKLSVTSVTQALQGNAAGVQVVQSTGQPGENPAIRIRGISSLGAANSPLYVVDGVPFVGYKNSINPSDIETYSVLKDAAASALYGSRAANGVIVITTKQGRKSKDAKINLKVTQGYSERAVDDYDYINGEDYYKLYWEALRNKYDEDWASILSRFGNDFSEDFLRGYFFSGQNNGEWASGSIVNNLKSNPFGVSNPILTDGTLNPDANLLWNTNFTDALTRVAQRNEYQLSVSGGSERTQYYISGGYLDQEGIAIASDFKRYSGRFNLTSQIKKWAKVGVNTNVAYTTQNYPISSGTSYVSVVYFGRALSSIYTLYQRDPSTGEYLLDDKGERIYEMGKNRPLLSNTNPVAQKMLDIDENSTLSSSFNTFADLTFLKDFTFSTRFSGNFYNRREASHRNSLLGESAAYGGGNSINTTSSIDLNFYTLLKYNKSIDLFNIDALVGHESNFNQLRYLSAYRTGLASPDIHEVSGAVLSNGSSYTNEEALESYFSEVKINYDDRFYLSGSYRRDGSSRFHKNIRWGDFYSVGFTYRLNKEGFLKQLSFINALKLRTSYGTSGNKGTSSLYPYLGLYTTGYDNLSIPGILWLRMPAEDLEWEKKKKFNVALEWTLFDSRFSGTVEYYNDKSNDLIMNRPLARSTGFTSVWENVGDMKNSGFEVELSSVNIKTHNFEWSTDFNISLNTNEITKLNQEKILQGTKQWEVGRSVYDFYIRDWAGVDPETGAGTWYVDVEDADGNITKETTASYNAATRYYVGSALPDAVGGLTNNFKFSGFDFSFLLAYSLGGKVYDGDYASLMHSGENTGRQWSIDILDRWTEPGQETNVPKLTANNNSQNGTSTRFLYDADYVRLRNVSLGYTLPKNWLKSIYVSKARLFVQGDNLWTWSKNKGLDPEQALSGVTDNRYATSKTITFGIDVTF